MSHSALALSDNRIRSYIVYNCPEMEGLTEKLVINATNVMGPRSFVRRQITWSKFPNGMINIFIHDIRDVRNRHVIFVASFSSIESMSNQLDAIYVLTRSNVASLTVVLPFWPVGTMERVDEEGQVATADVWAWRLSCLPMTAGGPTRLIIYDIHALAERFFFHGGALPYFVSAIDIFLPVLIQEHKQAIAAGLKGIAITFPDQGAQKRFGKLFGDRFEQIICAKVRDGDRRIVTIQEGDAENHHCVIVDDLVRSGGTLIECLRALKAKGAAKVSAYCTHADFESGKEQRIINRADGAEFEKFWLTDSCPIAQSLDGKGPFVVLSLADHLYDHL